MKASQQFLSPKWKSTPRYFWIQTVHADGTIDTRQTSLCRWQIAYDRARSIVANTNPPVDVVFILRHGCDPDNPDPRPRPGYPSGDILARFEQRDFTESRSLSPVGEKLRVGWRGDRLQCHSVTGSRLQTAKADSRAA